MLAPKNASEGGDDDYSGGVDDEGDAEGDASAAGAEDTACTEVAGCAEDDGEVPRRRWACGLVLPASAEGPLGAGAPTPPQASGVRAACGVDVPAGLVRSQVVVAGAEHFAGA